jgi:DNA-binding LytR/AlgR family response regulator
MDGMLKKLPANFIRVHRSYIVNLNAIDKVNGNTVEVNNQSISVSKTYHNDLMNHLGLKVKQKISSTEEVDIAV